MCCSSAAKFGEFDTDGVGGLDSSTLMALLVQLNGGDTVC